MADAKFKVTLGNASPGQPGDTIFETSYAPNHLTYKAKSAKGGIAVFSEIYFPWGWDVTIDGKPAQLGRANYVLRALRIPAGEHTIDFRFDPKSLKVTNGISIAAVSIIYILCALSLFFLVVYVAKKNKE